MKKIHSILSVLLALALMLALCACGGKTAETPAEESSGSSLASSIRDAIEEAGDAVLSEWAGEYSFFCARISAAYMNAAFELGGEVNDIPDQYVELPNMTGETVTLEADGTGYLYWGDDNQGPIDWWTMDGDALQFQAGVDVIDGTIIDGIMTVELDDGFFTCFALPGADTSGIKPITTDDYISMLLDSDTEEDAAPAEDLPVEGEYTLFAVASQGYLVYADALEASSTLTLAADGKGHMVMDDEDLDVTLWTRDGDALTITLSDDSSAEGVVRSGGVIELDIWGTGEMILVYAREDADTSAYAPMTMEEFQAAAAAGPDTRLYALWASLDTAAGVHLRYDRHLDYMDSDQSFDVHGKDGVYYSSRTTYVSGYENTTITFFRDGTAYNLDPEDMTGIIATTTTSSYIMDNVIRMDDLYSDICKYGPRPDCTEETRELDDVSYTVEVFSSGAAFYFDDAGQLAYYITDIDGIGEAVYTIHAIDGAVDEALFDISGYEIAD